MSDKIQLHKTILETQKSILSRLTSLNYEEVVRIISSLSSDIYALDKLLADEEIECNKLINSEMERNSKTSFSKAEAILKASELYRAYKASLNLKHLASRGLALSRIHVHYLLRSRDATALDTSDSG